LRSFISRDSHEVMKRKPTIMFLNRTFPGQKGLNGRLLADLAQAFVKDGWEVSVVTTDKNYKISSTMKRLSGLSVYRVGTSYKKTLWGYFVAYMRLLIKGLSLPGHHIVVTLTDPPMLITAGQLIARVKGSRHVHWCQDVYPDLLPPMGVKIPKLLMSFLKRHSKKALNKSYRIVTTGRCMARHMIKKGVQPKKISVIPNWYDADLLLEDKTFKGTGEKKKGKALAFTDDDNKFRVLYTGKLSRLHPIQPIVKAAQSLQKTHPDIEFVFSGDGVGYKNLARARSELGLTNIRLLPEQPAKNLPVLARSGDIHLVILHEKAVGMSVPGKFYSALAVERPVLFLGPEECEVGQIIDDYGCGTVIAPDNLNGFLMAVQSYRESSSYWDRAHKGAVKAAKVLTPEQSLQLWLDKMQSILRDL